MNPEQAERLLTLAREAVEVAERHRSRLALAPGDVKQNLSALRALIEEIDRGS
jgi:hypothetical protein